MKNILILSMFSINLLLSNLPIHDLMDSRVKGKSYYGDLDDNKAASDGLGITPLQHYFGTSEINNELLFSKK